jgi:hypothetical protein
MFDDWRLKSRHEDLQYEEICPIHLLKTKNLHHLSIFYQGRKPGPRSGYSNNKKCGSGLFRIHGTKCPF